MSKIKIIDGNSLLFRSFYAMFRPNMDFSSIMHSKDGTPTNAIYIFHKFIKQLKSDLSSDDRIVVCFDTHHKTFRSEKYEVYKAQRKPLEPELAVQLPIAREMLDVMGIKYCEMPGFEADDIAGSLAILAKSRGDSVQLFTSDRDYLQLLQEGIEVHFLLHGLKEILVYTHENLKELYGVNPNQVTDYKGMVGDVSDNLKGIPGIGVKTTIKLLATYEHLEAVIEAMKELHTKTAANILSHAEEGLFCKEMATMVLDLPVEEFYSQSKVSSYDTAKLLEFYKKYDLTSFINQIDSMNNSKESKVNEIKGGDLESHFVVKMNENNLGVIKHIDSISKIKSIKPHIIVADYDGANYHKAEIRGFFLASSANIYFLSGEDARLDEGFKALLQDETFHFDCFDLKALIVILKRLGFELSATCDFDLMLAAYLVDANVDSEVASILASFHYPLENQRSLYEQAACAILALKDGVMAKLADINMSSLYSHIELPLASTLAHMEIEGVPLSIATLAEYGSICHKELDSLAKKILAYQEQPFNLNSPRQVASFLYETLGLPKYDKKGSTANEILVKLVDKHPAVSMLLRYRKFSKLISSYTDSLPQSIFEDQKLHAIFNQALTTTGRLSMMEPNLQNISIRSEEGKEIRKAFFYEDKNILFLSYDYSQVELRILAHLCEDEGLLSVFCSEEDIHTSTAAKLFNVPLDEVTPDKRRIAKTVNFSIVYGTSVYGLSEKLECSTADASAIIKAFYNTFPGIKRYENEVIEFAKEHGYTKTLLGRRRYLKDINSSNYNLREFSYRAGVNATIQGTAADLIKIAMIQIEKLLAPYKSKMILQIHDELIFKVYKDELDEISIKIKNAMVGALQLKCPLSVEGSSGRSWYDAK